MKEITATNLRRELADLMKDAETNNEVVRITKHNKTVAAIIGPADLYFLEAMKAANKVQKQEVKVEDVSKPETKLITEV